jgi:23S rRNA pseudouridine1911/1915/1917 synthase
MQKKDSNADRDFIGKIATPLLTQAHILFHDDDVLVLNKPAGILSQKDKSGAEDVASLLQNLLKAAGRAPKFLAPVHRLDRNTSGLLLLACNSKAAAKLTELMQEGDIQREYMAIVKGDPGASGEIRLALSKNERTNEVRVDPYGKLAVTHFTRIKKMANSSLLAVSLETGRSHQIRVHFAHQKHPLIGDKKYAPRPWDKIFSRPALHAHKLDFVHPTNEEEMSFTAPLPEDMQGLLKSLGG